MIFIWTHKPITWNYELHRALFLIVWTTNPLNRTELARKTITKLAEGGRSCEAQFLTYCV